MDIQKHKSTYYIFFIVANAAFGTFFFGYMIGVFNPTQETIEIIDNWGDSKPFYDGLVTGLMPLGAIVGAYSSVFLATKIGRRYSFILADIIAIIGCVITIFIGNVPLFLGRFIGGVAVGINSAVVPLYINEISPVSISGVMGSMTQLTCNVGILFSFLLGLNIPKIMDIEANPDGQWWWRFMFAFPILTALLRSFLLLTLFKFETPSYLISKGKDEEAKEVIAKFYNEIFTESIYNEYKSRMNTYKDVTFSELFGRRYRSRMLTGLGLGFIQQCSGVNAVLFYSNKIFKGDQPPELVDPFDDTMAKVFTILIGSILIFSSGLSGKFIDNFGRKSLLILGEIFCSVTLALLAALGYLGIPNVSQYIILIYMFSFGLSLGPIVWVYLPEILPAKGVSLAVLANWVGCGIIGVGFPIVVKIIQIQGTFLVFLGCCIAATIFFLFFIKETKGKTAEEIGEMFGEENFILDEEKKLMSGNTSVQTFA